MESVRFGLEKVEYGEYDPLGDKMFGTHKVITVFAGVLNEE